MRIKTKFGCLLAVAMIFPGIATAEEQSRDIRQKIIYTMQEPTDSDYGIDLARQAGSEVLVRAWFKWNKAPKFDAYRWVAEKVHGTGGLLGGGITCSALYDAENGISREQLLDMATRGPDGKLVDAWGNPGIRHGSLSSPAYREYLFRWCREQIDAGADYLFMDEHTAALSSGEGYDDYSLVDFRHYLLENCPESHGWTPVDLRWSESWKIDLANHEVCPDGTMGSFDYRGYLRVHGCIGKPDLPANKLHGIWSRFRQWRDDRVWKELTDRIRAYGRERGRTILISANGLARYVDLQILGVWGQWNTTEGHIDLGDNKLPYWRSQVLHGRALAESRVPVVIFHDWGFGNPPFPWLAVPPAERVTWMRTGGAEIFAAGACFAFPVLGPFGCDAKKDGTLSLIAQQTVFYRAHRGLYLNADYVGAGLLHSCASNLSLVAWSQNKPSAVLLHVINRNLAGHALQLQKNVTVDVPVGNAPFEAIVISPDFPGERPATCRLAGGKLEINAGDLDAYNVVILRYAELPNLSRLKDPARTRPTGFWARPARNQFRVRPDGMVENADELNSFLQGKLHQELRNPPVFLVNATAPGRFSLLVRAVATAGARLEYRVDDRPAEVVELPDLDHKDDGEAREYDKIFTFQIPAGSHRLMVDNSGGDWMTVTWFEFDGTFEEVTAR